MKGKGSGWKGESRRHSLARKGVSTVIDQDRRFDVSNFVAKGRVAHGYDIDKIYNGFIEAMLWSTREMGLKDDEEIYLDENYGIYDIDKDTEQAIKHLIEDFMEENYELFDEIQINDNIHISEGQIGHDLLLTTQGHGVGFWDRGYGLNGEILTKESEKFFNDSMYAFSHDGKIYFEGIELKASGKYKGTLSIENIEAKNKMEAEEGFWDIAIEDKEFLDVDIRASGKSNKSYNVLYGIGKSKYVVNYHDGKKQHKDGSKFFDIAIFSNQKKMLKFINELKKKGYMG